MVAELDLIIQSNNVIPKQFMGHYAKYKYCLSQVEIENINLRLDLNRIGNTFQNKQVPVSDVVNINEASHRFVAQLSREIEPLFRDVPDNIHCLRLVGEGLAELSKKGVFSKDLTFYHTSRINLNLNVETDLLQKIDDIIQYASVLDLTLLYRIKDAFSVSDILTVFASCPKIVVIFGVPIFFSKIHGIIYDKKNNFFIDVINTCISKAYSKTCNLGTRCDHFVRAHVSETTLTNLKMMALSYAFSPQTISYILNPGNIYKVFAKGLEYKKYFSEVINSRIKR